MDEAKITPYSELKPIFRERLRNFRSYEIIFWTLISIYVLWLYILKPIPNAVYNEALAEVFFYLFIIYLAFRLLYPDEVFTIRFATVGLLFSSYAIFFGLSLVSDNAEVVLVYADVFKALENGNNPYQGNHIYHRIEGGEAVYGNFNYLPLEIIPYYAAYSLAGTWNATILVATNLFLNALACCILWSIFSEIDWTRKTPLLAIVLLFHINYTSGLTLIFISLFLALQGANDSPEPRFVISLVMGLGFLTKFFFGIVAIFYVWNLAMKGQFKKLVLEFGLGVAIALVCILPFGLENVISATIFFQSELETRDELTSYFPNVLSGFAYALQVKAIYPIAAFLLFFTFLLVKRETKASRFFLGAVLAIFLLPTPEPQFLSSVFVIMLWAKQIEQ
ncbi:MAG: hypothetical protein ACE5OZ_07455 [Candidatus Heimdallarchaeota archaeon]